MKKRHLTNIVLAALGAVTLLSPVGADRVWGGPLDSALRTLIRNAILAQTGTVGQRLGALQRFSVGRVFLTYHGEAGLAVPVFSASVNGNVMTIWTE